jgi:hypothetical protein
MECKTASSTTLDCIPSNERKAVAVEVRWLSLISLAVLLENIPDFSRQDIQSNSGMSGENGNYFYLFAIKINYL